MNLEQAKVALESLTTKSNPFNTLKAMIGASGFCLVDKAVCFKFKMCRFSNYFRLELDEGHDLYNMVFMKIKRFDIVAVRRFDGIYADQLKEIFERETGLRLNL